MQQENDPAIQARLALAKVSLVAAFWWPAVRFTLHKSGGDALIFGHFSPHNLVASVILIVIASLVTWLILRHWADPLLDRMIERPSRFGVLWVLLSVFALFVALFGPPFVRDAAIGSWALFSVAWAVSLSVGRGTPTVRITLRRSLAPIGVIATSVAVSLAFLEIGVRLCNPHEWCRAVLSVDDPRLLPGKPYRFSPHPYLNYIPTPNYRSPDGLNRHNALGFRGPEIDLPKPEGRYRIVAVGGSTTYSFGVRDWRESYPRQLVKALREDFGYLDVDVVNAGVGGYTSWETLVNLQFRLVDLEPDLILFYHGTNDYHSRFVPPELYKADNTARRKSWDETYLSSWQFQIPSLLLRLIGLKFNWLKYPQLVILVGGSIHPNFFGEPFWLAATGLSEMEIIEKNRPIYFERNLRNFASVANLHGIKIVFLSFAYRRVASAKFVNAYTTSPHHTKAITEQNAIAEAVARDFGGFFFDLQARLPDDAMYWQEDGIHFTKQGNALRARLIAEFLHDKGLFTPPPGR